jgi:rhodanese-related sulfurtransferase
LKYVPGQGTRAIVEIGISAFRLDHRAARRQHFARVGRRHGTIPGSLHVPYPTLQESIRSGGMLHELTRSTSKGLLFYCAFDERSAMAVQAAQDAGLTAACHIEGGLDAWKKAGGPLAH